jgi:hypothetical protein
MVRAADLPAFVARTLPAQSFVEATRRSVREPRRSFQRRAIAGSEAPILYRYSEKSML